MPSKRQQETAIEPVKDIAVEEDIQAASDEQQTLHVDLPLPPVKVIIPHGHRFFAVTDGTSCFSHGGERFPVLNGHVILPEASWYQDLVKAGTLTAAKP